MMKKFLPIALCLIFLLGVSVFSQTAQHGVTLSWTAPAAPSEPAASYNVYRAPSNAGTCGSFAKIGSATSTTYFDPGATGNTYCYEVTSVDAAGMESDKSNSVTATEILQNPPGALAAKVQ